jgi:hypothetical protein
MSRPRTDLFEKRSYTASGFFAEKPKPIASSALAFDLQARPVQRHKSAALMTVSRIKSPASPFNQRFRDEDAQA